MDYAWIEEGISYPCSLGQGSKSIYLLQLKGLEDYSEFGTGLVIPGLRNWMAQVINQEIQTQ